MIQNRRTVNTENYELSKSQDALNQSLEAIQKKIPFTPNNIIQVAVQTTDTTVEHKLGKAYSGYIVIDRDAGQTVFTSPTANPDSSLYLILRATAVVNAKVMVF